MGMTYQSDGKELTNTKDHRTPSLRKLKKHFSEREYCKGRAGVVPRLVYDFYITLLHPQLYLKTNRARHTTTNHNSAHNAVIAMTKCRKMEFPTHWV